jgi:hypothetical protein
MNWSYNVMLGVNDYDKTGKPIDRRCVLEAGAVRGRGFDTSTEALTFAVDMLGRTVAEVKELTGDSADWFEGDESDNHRHVVGYTIERYNREFGTDTDWCMIGDLKRVA